MSLTGNNGLLAAAGANQPAYSIDNSLRGGSGNNLQFAGVASNRKTLTFSTWYKRTEGVISGYSYMFAAGPNGSNYETLVFYLLGSVVMYLLCTKPLLLIRILLYLSKFYF